MPALLYRRCNPKASVSNKNSLFLPAGVITKGQRESFEREAEQNAPTVYVANALALAVFASYTASSPLLVSLLLAASCLAVSWAYACHM